MQTGVEIHLHQGKPGVRAANTHRVGQAFYVWLITQSRVLERLFEHGPTYTSRPTVRQANVRREIRKPSKTRRGAPEASARRQKLGTSCKAWEIALCRNGGGSVAVAGGFKAQCASRTQKVSPMIHPMTDNSDRTALVTGASSGIGEATALQLAELGFTVYAGARRVDRMSDLADRGIRTRPVDVTDDASMVALVETILADTGRIDVLVNNAGYGMYGALEDVPIDEARRQFEVNVFGLARLIQLVLPQMRARGDGYIVNISSMGGKIWEPLGSWYHASKFAVEGLSDSLRVEVAEFGIKVVIIEPGTIRSEWSAIAADKLEAASAHTPYARQAKLVGAGLRSVDRLPIAGGPEVVAEVIAKAVQSPRPRTRYPAGGGARAILLAERILPDRGFDRFIQLGYRFASR
jgi:NAD(P)-dependent dehydrogenase (short-subunit alcohol dehydrogenase family)